jgi:Fic-DOC domain mobile mystery protein B
MGLKIDYSENQTTLDEDEKDGLLIKAITKRQELDEFEQINIERAIDWTMRKRIKSDKILTEKFVCKLHHKMFDQTWKWAGDFRKTNKNIGVDKYKIGVELNQLLNDCKYWIANNIFGPDEIALRLKHRVVKIHPFPNGNGRLSRLLADVLITHVYNLPAFTWGSKRSDSNKAIRKDYLKALFAADDGNYALLIEFSRQ